MGAKDQFPESMYAFAATHELSRLTPWWATHVPIMPTLRRERRGGYDVRFDLPGSVLLIQYKSSIRRAHLRLTEKQRKKTVLVSNLRTLAASGLDQFWTVDHQHKLLARIAKRFPFCYYAAPRFTSRAELDYLFSKRKVLASSILVKLEEFPLSKGKGANRHRVIAPLGSDRHFIFSEPVSRHNVDMRRELRWTSWEEDRPLAETLDEIWKSIPRGNKTEAIRYARHEVAVLRGVRPALDLAVDTREAFIPPPVRELVAPRRTRRPPWLPNTFRPNAISTDQGDYYNQLQRLTALSYLFGLIGIEMSIVQPSQKAV